MKLKTIIVDDDNLSQSMLMSILEKHCSSRVELVDVCSTVEQSVISIQKNKPHLVFLEIKLEDNEEGGFHILERLEKIDFSIVITAVINKPNNILKAINQYNALKYLVKPLEPKMVIEAVERATNELELNTVQLRMEASKKVLDTYTLQGENTRLRILQANGIRYLQYDSVVMIKSDGKHAIIFDVDGNKITSNKSLRYFEDVLPENKFLRVSRLLIVNIDHIEGYSKEDGVLHPF